VTRRAGSGFWPGGRERSVPPGFPGEGDEPRPDPPRDSPYEAETVEERRPEPDPTTPMAASVPKRKVPRGVAWPGEKAGRLPLDFPGGGGAGGNIVFRKPRQPELKVVDPPRKAPKPPKRRVVVAPTNEPQRLRVPLPGRLNDVVAAVYAALADPLSADSAEAREARAARVRKAGSMAATAALVAIGIYGIFPVRTFLNQRQTTAEAEERLKHLTEANDKLAKSAEQLKDDDEIELRARRDYGWVFPGEESYRVLPAPTAPTTSAPEDEDDDG